MKRSEAASGNNDGTGKRRKFWSCDSHPAEHRHEVLRNMNILLRPRGGTSSSGDQHPAAPVNSILQEHLLEWLMNEITACLGTEHNEPSLGSSRSSQDKNRKFQRISKDFGSIVNSLRRASSEMWNETFDNEWSSELGDSVVALADAVVWKLEANCPEDAEEGTQLMKQMLYHLEDEFKWQKILQVLEASAKFARYKKADCYRDAEACQESLRELRSKGY